jgi:hypothetical protein
MQTALCVLCSFFALSPILCANVVSDITMHCTMLSSQAGTAHLWTHPYERASGSIACLMQGNMLCNASPCLCCTLSLSLPAQEVIQSYAHDAFFAAAAALLPCRLLLACLWWR